MLAGYFSAIGGIVSQQLANICCMLIHDGLHLVVIRERWKVAGTLNDHLMQVNQPPKFG
jgi:hypothetical protein